MSNIVCFFCTTPKRRMLFEQYTLNDIKILESLGYEVRIASNIFQIPIKSKLIFCWWLTSSSIAITYSKILNIPSIMICGGNECNLLINTKYERKFGYFSMNLLKRIAVKISLKFATHLLPVSEYLYKSIAILSPSSLKKSKVVANCVDLENIYSFNYRPSRDVFTIVTVCSYDERSIDVKNLHTLMHASFALAQKDLHVHLTIIGRDGPCFAMIEQYMNSHLPKQRFTLYKDLYIHQVFDVLSTCSLFVQISAVETFGLAAMEAACLGVPLLLSNEGALPEIFRNRAYFVSSDISSDSLASYLYDLIRQPTINNLNDLIYFRKNYSLEQRMLSLQSVINNVLAT